MNQNDDLQQRVNQLQAALQDLQNQQQQQMHALQQQQQQQQQQPPQPPRAKPLPTLFFTDEKGGESWRSFKRRFEKVLRLHHYDDREAQDLLIYCLKGNAAKITEDLEPNAPGQTLDDLIDICEARFITPAASALARAQLDSATQQVGENLRAFHGRLREMHRRAYPHWQHGVDAMLIRRFALGVRHHRVRDQILRVNPDTYEQALAVAQTEQSIYVTTHPNQFHPEPIPRKTAGSKEEPMDIGFIAALGALRCFNCRSPRHVVKDCPKVRNQFQRKATGDFK